jgi:hypothetical protein
MKRIEILLCIMLFLLSSCDQYIYDGAPDGTGQINRVTDLVFNKVELIYDLGTKFDTRFLADDLDDFKFAHGVSKSRDTIKSLLDIVRNADCLEESNKPSIYIALHCPDTVIEKTYKNYMDVGDKALYGIPAPDDVKTGTVVIKTCKTFMHGIQVRWEKEASQPNWPLKEVVSKADSKNISGNAPAVTKGGTNNGNGDAATRNGGIITNTYYGGGDIDPIGDLPTASLDPREIEYEGDREKVPFYSPTLCRPVYSGGTFRSDIEWDKPIIVKISQL